MSERRSMKKKKLEELKKEIEKARKRGLKSLNRLVKFRKTLELNEGSMSKIKKAYQDILKVCEKYTILSENSNFDDIADMVSTGAYIFGNDYDEQKQLFQDFIDELKTYKPDFLDSANKSLYWRLENSKKIYKAFDGILKKYHEKNNSQLKSRKVKKLKEELKQLSK